MPNPRRIGHTVVCCHIRDAEILLKSDTGSTSMDGFIFKNVKNLKNCFITIHLKHIKNVNFIGSVNYKEFVVPAGG